MGRKLTFSVDDATVRTLRATAERLGKPQSMVVREAVAEYAARAGQLTDAEQRRLLKIVDAMTQAPVARSRATMTRELREIRAARRIADRRPPARERTR
ncbi:MAG TPA: ribbon-helix-helix protein, CopG family [Vicinamibacterales bacterium]|nr:ribbon-helix-helix protein, CopG family [Vicinamibacterales bacterium]